MAQLLDLQLLVNRIAFGTSFSGQSRGCDRVLNSIKAVEILKWDLFSTVAGRTFADKAGN